MAEKTKTDYIVEDRERTILDTVLRPKLKLGMPVNLFCSFAYFTSNYTGINLIHELSQLAREGFHLNLVLWDTTARTHDRFRKLLGQESDKLPDTLISEKIDEILALFRLFKAPERNIKLYRASDVLSRFMRKPDLFLQFFATLEKMELNNLVHRHKVSHIVQMPLDICFANFFHELYPEEIDMKNEVALIYGYQEIIYKEVRNILYTNNIINTLNPLLLKLHEYPYLLHNTTLPEWDMSRHSMINHVLECKPSTDAILQLYNVILCKFLKEFELVDAQGVVKKLPWDSFKKAHEKISLTNQQVSLGHNLKNYLQGIKHKVKIKKTPRILRLDESNTEQIGKVLSRKPLMRVLKKVDGHTPMELARELKMAPPHISLYLGILKENGLIEVENDGRIHRKITAINANFEAGMS